MKIYKFLVSICHGWCDGFLEIKAENEDEAYEKAMDYVGDKLADAFPDLDIPFNVECDNPDEEYIVKCKDCGKEMKEWDASYVTFANGDDYICEDCLDSGKYGYCEVCETWYKNEDNVEVYGLRGGTVCSECYDTHGWIYE